MSSISLPDMFIVFSPHFISINSLAIDNRHRSSSGTSLYGSYTQLPDFSRRVRRFFPVVDLTSVSIAPSTRLSAFFLPLATLLMKRMNLLQIDLVTWWVSVSGSMKYLYFVEDSASILLTRSMFSPQFSPQFSPTVERHKNSYCRHRWSIFSF